MRKCKQCDEELITGEVNYCSNCFDYIEKCWWDKKRRKQEANRAAHSKD